MGGGGGGGGEQLLPPCVLYGKWYLIRCILGENQGNPIVSEQEIIPESIPIAVWLTSLCRIPPKICETIVGFRFDILADSASSECSLSSR